MWQRGRRRRRRQQGGGGPASPELGTLPPSSSPADPLLPALASTRLVAFRSYFDKGSQLRQPRGVRFEHVRPSIQGGGRQAGQGHWWAPGWRRGMGETPAGGRGGGGHRVSLGRSAAGNRKRGWRLEPGKKLKVSTGKRERNVPGKHFWADGVCGQHAEAFGAGGQ